MLNLWIGFKDFDNLVSDPDFYFSEFIDPACIETELGKRIVMECSDVENVVNYATMYLPTGELISARELSSGAKNLLIMAFDDDDAVCEMTFCGDNCNKFVGEIANSRDITVSTMRWYVPFSDGKEKDAVYFADGVRILNTGAVVHNYDEYVDHLMETGLEKLL